MADNNLSTMDFDITDDQREVLELVDAACKRIEPIEVKSWREHKQTPRKDIVDVFGGAGLLGMPIDTKYGGAGLDKLTYALSLARIAKVSGSLRTFFSGHTSIGGLTVQEWGTEAQKQKYLPRVCSGEYIMAFGLTEPEAGSDPRNMSSTYEERGDEFILNGNKTLISNGTIADLVTVYAKKKGTDHVSGFIVETSTRGFTSAKLEGKVSLISSDTSQFFMQDVAVPKENLLGQEGKGMNIAYATLMNGRLSVAAGCLGELEHCLEESVKYAQQRCMHGKEIGKHQLVQDKIARMATDLEASRLLVCKAAVMKQRYDDHKAAHGEDRKMRDAVIAQIAKTKLFVTNAAQQGAWEAMQVHGGNGIFDEYAVARHWADTRVSCIYEGTNEMLKLMIASHELGPGFDAYK